MFSYGFTLIILMYLQGCELKASQVIAASEEIHLEPFKEKMEIFFVQAKERLAEEEENLDECKQK